ncbi:AAA family ATPase [Actinocorallia longicatena]|uniref:AAA family ATPase n=1 Tax=Actinocorallia longicatena TaxID=111803 RepID=A0ABP6QJR4_9ACTN
MTSAEPDRELIYPAGSLVLLAGLPGAGKSTLLRRLYGLDDEETAPVAAGGALVIDSKQSRNWWAQYLGALPRRARIPFVYSTHVWRIGRSLTRGEAVVAHTRGTWPHLLYGFAWLARRLGTGLHLILLDVPPQTALDGQHARGRILTSRAFAWHVRRWAKLIVRARTGSMRPATTVTVLNRADADKIRTIRFQNSQPRARLPHQ